MGLPGQLKHCLSWCLIFKCGGPDQYNFGGRALTFFNVTCVLLAAAILTFLMSVVPLTENGHLPMLARLFGTRPDDLTNSSLSLSVFDLITGTRPTWSNVSKNSRLNKSLLLLLAAAVMF